MFREEFAGIDPNQYQVDARDHRSGLTDGRNWTVFPFYDGFGNLQVDNARKSPGIAEFLGGRAGSGSIGCMAFFSIMNPKPHVPPQHSASNTRMRYHLGIEVPERDIHFRIHDQLITWKQDRCIKIDDSDEHEVFQRVRPPPGRVRPGRAASGTSSRGIRVSAGVHVIHNWCWRYRAPGRTSRRYRGLDVAAATRAVAARSTPRARGCARRSRRRR